ncbi:MAG: methyltransferase, partial [Sphingomonas sp.]
DGYFTRMLSDVVGPTGHVYGLDNKGWGNATSLAAALSAGRYTNASAGEDVFGAVHFPKPLDLAWVTQNYHDLKIAKYGVVDTLAFDRKVFAALKPGGIFFILDHDAAPGLDSNGIARLHRIPKAQVIREVTAAGFTLVAQGDFLHRTSDDHTLPVSDKRVQGHTDQYALRFEKPRG